MNIKGIIGISILALVWIWLVWAILKQGITLMNILTVIMSGIIIFVPLCKKYLKPKNK